MVQPIPDITEHLLVAARRAGADAADAIAMAGTKLTIDVREGALEEAGRAEDLDIGLRVFIGKRQATVSASDNKPATIETLANRAVAMAREAPEDAFAGLADASALAQSWDLAALDLVDPGDEPAPAALEARARLAEEAARAQKGISKSDGASAWYVASQTHLAATNGFSGGSQRTAHGVSVTAITGSGTDMERDGAFEARVFQSDLPSPEEVGSLAGHRAAARAGARKPPTGAYPVLYDERISGGLIGHLLGAANGASVARGASWLRDAMGELVLPEALSIIEEPHRPRIAGSRAFDAEGLPTTQRALVKDGRLEGWILDLATARKLGADSTGNAARGVSGPPMPRPHNITLTPGAASFDDLLADMGTGLLVTSMLGASINATTGDYSRGASGFWVENGEITYPVNECTIAGNLRDMLRRVVPANDAKAHKSQQVPSLLVEGLTLAGA
ncbi:MAG: metallopeptidase TldD-related protein [Pseudomonadota bacterium]